MSNRPKINRTRYVRGLKCVLLGMYLIYEGGIFGAALEDQAYPWRFPLGTLVGFLSNVTGIYQIGWVYLLCIIPVGYLLFPYGAMVIIVEVFQSLIPQPDLERPEEDPEQGHEPQQVNPPSND